MATPEKTGFAAARAEVEEFTPKTGFNVVGVDSWAMLGEALYLVGHYETMEEAEKARAENAAETGDSTHVYKPRGA